MKRAKLVLLATLFIALSVITWEARRVLPFLVMFAMEPPGSGCDEGPVIDRRFTNARGDVVEEYEKTCTGFGTVIDYSIVLQRRGDEKTMTLVAHDDLQYDYPKFSWVDDDTLVVDLGKISWLSSPVDQVGSIHITYVYTKTGTGWW